MSELQHRDWLKAQERIEALEAENAELRAALRTTVTAVQAPIHCFDHADNCCLSWCKICQTCHANLVAEEEAVQKAEELLKRIKEAK